MRLVLRSVLSICVAALIAVAALPAGWAGSSESPEMPDKTGDVDPLSLAGLKPEELEPVQGNASMFDIKSAYATGENPSGFWFVVNVVDLDGGLQSTPLPVPPPVPPPTPPLIATFDVHFQAAGEGWIARATLEPKHYLDATQEPPVAWAWFAANFTLHKDDADATLVSQVYGIVSAQHEAVMIHIPKELIGQPATGDLMEGLYATSTANGQVVDLAPDAVLDPTAVDPAKPLQTGLRAQYGTPYEFGQYRGSGAAAKLELQALGETAVTAKSGETVELPLTLKNLGTTELTVRIGMITPRGWTTSAEPETVTLAGGSSDAIVIRATPDADAGRQAVLKVAATTAHETQTVVFVLQSGEAASGTDGGGTPGAGPGQSGGPGQSLSDGTTEDSPGVGLFAILGIVGLVLARHRRRSDR